MRRLALLLAALLLVPTVAADWPSFHNDSRNTGFQSGSDYATYVDVWWSDKAEEDAQIKASPVVKDGMVVIADLKGLVRAVDGESGSEVWRHQMAKGVEGTPAIAGERVYVVDSGGALVALNLRDGRVEHTAKVGATLGSITLHEGKLFIGTENGEMKAYLASTLTLLWTFSTKDIKDGSYAGDPPKWSCTGTAHSAQPIRGAPAIFDGKVFFGSLNHYVYAVDEQGLGNGKTVIQWQYQTGDVVVGAPAVVIRSTTDQFVVVGSYDGKMYAFRPSPGGEGGNPCDGYDHNPTWTYQAPSIVDPATGETQVSRIHSSPASSGDKVYFGANNGNVYALQSSNGALAWEQTGPAEEVTSSPAVANDLVVVGSDDKKVYWLSATDGTVRKTFATEAAVATSPAVSGERAYVAATDGVTYAFGPEVPPRPDLVVARVTGTQTSLSVLVRNAGDADAGATQLRVSLNGTFLALLDVPAIKAGNETTIDHSTPLGFGGHDVTATVDPEGDVTESDEANNGFEGRIVVFRPPSENGGDDKGIPGPGLVAFLVALGAALWVRRR